MMICQMWTMKRESDISPRVSIREVPHVLPLAWTCGASAIRKKETTLSSLFCEYAERLALSAMPIRASFTGGAEASASEARNADQDQRA